MIVTSLTLFKKNKKQGSKFIDIGGGSGAFARLVKDNCPDIDVPRSRPVERIIEYH